MKNICNLTKSERSEYKIKYLSNINSSSTIFRSKSSIELTSKSNDLITKIRSCSKCPVNKEDLETAKSIKNMALTLEIEENVENNSATEQAYALYSYMLNEFEHCQ